MVKNISSYERRSVLLENSHEQRKQQIFGMLCHKKHLLIAHTDRDITTRTIHFVPTILPTRSMHSISVFLTPKTKLYSII